MSHKSRLGCIVIDCKTDDLSDALVFWSSLLGLPGSVDDDGKYAVIQGPGDDIRVLIQAVDHEPRVHLDIETDDKEAERARLAALGAREVRRLKSWIVMEAPTGHRFCIVDPQRREFDDNAATWEEA
ncbi:VOC family protein [Rhodobium gokarnense]|uniref:Enzyme related to lactoylglutathione lyase n=1 Tax=Rhodobium gokarnense TaxID=364296 RepID=A0ABT3H6P5_9HYPH|nr:VOC family protein [Rhodobium gokarnense]MCW2306056.1 putative enzyme related to lactoylglutathione lyase [Rhodobium gokarnense]